MIKISDIVRDAMKIAAVEIIHFDEVFRKPNAIHKIRLQSFFGHYWQGKKVGNTVRIRMPNKYKTETL